MASQFNPIAALVQDDTGTPGNPNGDGTQINSSLFAAIDAILNELITRSAKTVGGVWTWESFGAHNFTAGAAGVNQVAIRNTLAGVGNRAELQLQGDTASVVTLQKFSSTHSASGAISADGARLVLTGSTGTLGFETVSSGGFRFFPGGGHRVTFDFTNGAVAENTFGWSVKNSAGTVIPGFKISATNEISIGSDNALGVNDTVLGGGSAVRIRVGSAERMVVDNLAPQVLIGDGAVPGSTLTMQMGNGTAPVSAQTLFGTDGSGWQYRIGKNTAGAITYLWRFETNGHFAPMSNNAYNIGATSERVAALYTTDINLTGSILPNADNTCALGDATHRFATLRAMDAQFNDVSFANDWSITEGNKVGLGNGLAFLTKTGDLAMFIDDEGNLYTNHVYSLAGLKPYFKRTTREERNAS